MDHRQATPSASAPRPPRPQRILACLLCQQRKVKCERKFPCSHCVKANVQCVPAQQMPRRRKKPSEQELMERIRRYEELLRKNDIAVEQIDDMDMEDWTADGEAGHASATSQMCRDGTAGVEVKGEVKDFWDAMHQRTLDSHDATEKASVDDNFGHAAFDDLSEPVIVKLWGRVYEGDHNRLFGDTRIDVPLSTLHPSHIHIFRLWQIYSENVSPLIKVTHGPTLQARILDAAFDPTGISGEFEALMFSIYCAALITLTEDQCRATFGDAKAKLLRKYHDACHQALVNCGFLRSRERDCLTAYFLYLISLRPDTHPHTLSAMFAIAFRIAYRMNMCSEAANAKHGVFEAEMRRRLWWAMVVYDSRISEMTDYKTTQLVPTWDCKIPVNVNDFDLRPGMNTPPVDQDSSTEALFAVVRAAIGDSIRHNAWHLDFINPMLRHIPTATQHPTAPNDDNLSSLEHMLEHRYLRHCNPENPLHYLTLWWSHTYLAKYRFFLHCSQHPTSPAPAQRDTLLSHALRILTCDTALTASPLTIPHRWLIQFHFPFPAYVRIVADLSYRPVGPHADRAWDVMTANYAARFAELEPSATLLFKMFASTVLKAWAARQKALVEREEDRGVRGMVEDIKRKLGMAEPLGARTSADQCAQMGRTEGEVLTRPVVGECGSAMGPEGWFDPSLAELNVDGFEMDFGGVDWTAMGSFGWS